MRTAVGLNFVNIKENSKEEDFKNYSFWIIVAIMSGKSKKT